MRILLVEDDHYIERDLISTLVGEHPNVSIDTIETEREFVESQPAIESYPPDLIILDVMLPWDYPRPDLTLPPDTDDDTFRLAGVRIYQRLRDTPCLSGIPVIFHSVFDIDSLKEALGDRPSHVLIVPKSSISVSDILVTMRSLVPHLDLTSPPPQHWWHRLFDALELKPGAFGFRVDLKKIRK